MPKALNFLLTFPFPLRKATESSERLREPGAAPGHRPQRQAVRPAQPRSVRSDQLATPAEAGDRPAATSSKSASEADREDGSDDSAAVTPPPLLGLRGLKRPCCDGAPRSSWPCSSSSRCSVSVTSSAEYVGLTNASLAQRLQDQCRFPGLRRHLHQRRGHLRGVTVGRVGAAAPDQQRRARRPEASTTAAAQDPGQRGRHGDRPFGHRRAVRQPDPAERTGHTVRGGEIIPMAATRSRCRPRICCMNLDNFVNSVNTANLPRMVTELGQAFNDQGPALGALLDSSDVLLNVGRARTCRTRWHSFEDRTRYCRPSWTTTDTLQAGHTTSTCCSQQLKASDADIRHLFVAGAVRPGGTVARSSRTTRPISGSPSTIWSLHRPVAGPSHRRHRGTVRAVPGPGRGHVHIVARRWRRPARLRGEQPGSGRLWAHGQGGRLSRVRATAAR